MLRPALHRQSGRFFHGGRVTGDDDLAGTVEVGAFNQSLIFGIFDNLLDRLPVQSGNPAHFAYSQGYRVLHEYAALFYQFYGIFELKNTCIDQRRVLPQTEPGRHVGGKSILLDDFQNCQRGGMDGRLGVFRFDQFGFGSFFAETADIDAHDFVGAVKHRRSLGITIGQLHSHADIVGSLSRKYKRDFAHTITRYRRIEPEMTSFCTSLVPS